MAPFIVLAVTFLLMWVLFILPQQRRMKAHQAVVAALKVGDDVMTTAGIYGRIAEVDGETVLLEVAPGIELRVARGAIGKVLEEADVADELDDGTA